MLDRLLQVFSRPKLPDEARELISKLATSEIWILAVGIRGTPSIPSPTDPAGLEIIADHRIDVSELGDDDSVFPFNYERDGRQVLPFFSSSEQAECFRTGSGFPAAVSLFQPYCLLAGFVTAPQNNGFELVLDPRSSAERTLTQAERRLLRSLAKRA